VPENHDVGTFVRSMLALSADLDATSIAEALWLASAMSADEAAEITPLPDIPGSRSVPGSEDRRDAAPEARSSAPDVPAVYLDQREAAPATGARVPGKGRRQVRGGQIQVRRTGALPQALDVARALRPFKKQWPRGQEKCLDIDATVEAYASTRQLIPVFRPAPERWFNVSLVVDDSQSMTVWREVIDEFAKLLRQVGAFRTVRIYRMSIDGPNPVLRTETGAPVGARGMFGPDGRSLIVVLSDGAAVGWLLPEVWQLLRMWAASTPTVVVSPLPARLWRRTGLDLPSARTWSATPGHPGARLRYLAPA